MSIPSTTRESFDPNVSTTTLVDAAVAVCTFTVTVTSEVGADDDTVFTGNVVGDPELSTIGVVDNAVAGVTDVGIGIVIGIGDPDVSTIGFVDIAAAVVTAIGI